MKAEEWWSGEINASASLSSPWCVAGTKHSKRLATWRYSSCTFQTIPVTHLQFTHSHIRFYFKSHERFMMNHFSSKKCIPASCARSRHYDDPVHHKSNVKLLGQILSRYFFSSQSASTTGPNIIEAYGFLRRGHFVRLYHSIFLHSLLDFSLARFANVRSGRECPPAECELIIIFVLLLKPQMNHLP